MKFRKLLALMLALLLTVGLLTGCGASNGMPMDKAESSSNGYAPNAPAGGDDMEMDMNNSLSDSSGINQPDLPESEKIITTVHMNAETEELDIMLASINEKISQLGGYMEAQEIYNGSSYSSRRYRHAYMTIRIPAGKLKQFTEQVAEEANIVSSNTTTENVTLSYVAIESRITALETEQARLLALLEKAENMDDLLTIEARLTDVRYELEQITSQLRVMDNKVNYSTIHLELTEVKEYTEVVEPETFGERVASGFKKSLKGLGDALVEIAIFLLTRLPYLVLIGAIVTVAILLIKSKKRRKKEKKEPPKPIQTDEPK